jgi:predicted DCC family thiol-disulfide oxidoreductase YuxK
MIEKTKNIVFYDGDCLLCSRTILFLLKKDKKKKLLFAPLSGITSRSYPTMNSDEFKNTLVFLKKDVFLTESSGVLSILQFLPFPWKLLSVFRFIPPVIRNSVYKIVAKNRYKWFGRKENCLVLGDKYASSMLP